MFSLPGREAFINESTDLGVRRSGRTSDMGPTTRTKRQTSCRHHGSPEVSKSSKTKHNQTGENSFKRATEREVHHHIPADKGKATVITETREYQEQIRNILNYEATYEKLKKDPTKKYKAELIRMVNSLEKEGKITKDQYWY